MRGAERCGWPCSIPTPAVEVIACNEAVDAVQRILNIVGKVIAGHRGLLHLLRGGLNCGGEDERAIALLDHVRLGKQLLAVAVKIGEGYRGRVDNVEAPVPVLIGQDH